MTAKNMIHLEVTRPLRNRLVSYKYTHNLRSYEDVINNLLNKVEEECRHEPE